MKRKGNLQYFENFNRPSSGTLYLLYSFAGSGYPVTNEGYASYAHANHVS